MKANLIGVIEKLKQNEGTTTGVIKFYSKPVDKLDTVLFKDTNTNRSDIWKKAFDNGFYIYLNGYLVFSEQNKLLSVINIDPILDLNLLIKLLDETRKKENTQEKGDFLDVIGDL